MAPLGRGGPMPRPLPLWLLAATVRLPVAEQVNEGPSFTCSGVPQTRLATSIRNARVSVCLTLQRCPTEYASPPCASAPPRPKRRITGCALTRTRHASSRILSEPVSAPPESPEALRLSRSPANPLLPLPHRGDLLAPRPLIAARMESPLVIGTDKTLSVPSRSCEVRLIALIHSETLRPIGTFDNLKLFRANSRKQVTVTIASMVSEIYFSINFVWS
jgi:hypothetical protein